MIGKPETVSAEEKARAHAAFEAQTKGMKSMADYHIEATNLTPWTCPGCKSQSIPCSQDNCPHCGKGRPSTHLDADLDGRSGSHRKGKRGRYGDNVIGGETTHGRSPLEAVSIPD